MKNLEKWVIKKFVTLLDLMIDFYQDNQSDWDKKDEEDVHKMIEIRNTFKERL